MSTETVTKRTPKALVLMLASLVGPSFPLERADDAFRASLAGEPGRVLVTP